MKKTRILFFSIILAATLIIPILSLMPQVHALKELVVDSTTCKSLDNNYQPISRTATFDPETDNFCYAWIKLRNPTPGAFFDIPLVTWAWYYPNGNQYYSTVNGADSFPTSDQMFQILYDEIPIIGDVPAINPGLWRVKATTATETLVDLTFTISPTIVSQGPSKPLKSSVTDTATCQGLDSSNEPLNRVDTFDPTGAYCYAWIKFNSIPATSLPNSISWFWYMPNGTRYTQYNQAQAYTYILPSSPNGWGVRWAWDTLYIDGYPPADIPGLWRVTMVTLQNEVLWDHTFTISPRTSTVTATTDSGGTIDLLISGSIASSQMSNIKITTDQFGITTTLSFTVTGPSGTTGSGTITVPISAVPPGSIPVIYIDNQRAQVQSYTYDLYNYYLSYTTQFSSHQVSIVFSAPSNNSPLPSVPELQPWIILPLTTMIVLIVAIYFRRQRNAKF